MDIPLEFDPKSEQPLYRQLYDSVRAGILDGRFNAGLRLPASRALARSVGVSRITVTECYERLIAEGYLEARRGSGTFVRARLPELSPFALRKPDAPLDRGLDALSPRLCRSGTAVNVSLHRPTPPDTLRLHRHGPDVSQFQSTVG